MPVSNLDAVIGRSLRDDDFRKKMLANPDAIAGEYNLSAAELNQLKSISQEAADQFFSQLAAGGARPNCTEKVCYERG